MNNRKSIFSFEEEFNYDSPFTNWTKKVEIDRWEEAQLRNQKAEVHVHHAYDYPDPLKDMDCVDHGLWVKLVKRKGLIPCFEGNVPTMYNRHDLSALASETYFRPDTEVRYVELKNHLVRPDEGGDGQVGKVIKKEDFWYLVKGMTVDHHGKEIGEQERLVHSDLVETDEQMKFYHELDEMVQVWNTEDEAADRAQGEKAPERALLLYDKITENKKLNQLFDPTEMTNNTDRLYIGNTDAKLEAKMRLNELYITGGAAFGVQFEKESKEVKRIATKTDDHDPNEDSNKTPTILIRDFFISFPFNEATQQKGFTGNDGVVQGGFYGKTPYPNYTYLNMLEIVLTHELIHAHQSLIDASEQGERPFGKAPKKNYDHGHMRELLAYHFTIFPNKKYDHKDDDPVFRYTSFVRGESAKFGGLHEGTIAHWVWMGTRYSYKLLKNPSAIQGKFGLELKKCIDEITEVRNCLERKGYQFFDDENSDANREKPIISRPFSMDLDWFKDTNGHHFSDKHDYNFQTHNEIEKQIEKHNEEEEAFDE